MKLAYAISHNLEYYIYKLDRKNYYKIKLEHGNGQKLDQNKISSERENG